MSAEKATTSAVHQGTTSTQKGESGMTKELEDWLQQNERDITRFSSAAIYSELRLQEVISSTEGQDMPNLLRTRTACQLLEAVAASSGVLRGVLERLVREVLFSIFVNPEKPDSIPYFKKSKEIEEAFEVMRAKVDSMEEQAKRLKQISDNRQTVVLKMLNGQGKESTRNLLKLWRLIARTLKSARSRVEPVYKKKILLLQTGVLLSWRDLIIEKKAILQEDRVISLSKKIETLQQRVEELEKELEKEQLEKEEALQSMFLAEGKLNEHLERIKTKRIWDHEELRQRAGPSCTALFNALVGGLHTDIEKLQSLKVLLEEANTNVGLVAGEGKGEDRRKTIALCNLSPSEILLRWINSTCKRDGVICNNFSTDLQNGKVLALLLHEIRGNFSRMIKCVDPVQIWEAGLSACAEITSLEFLNQIDVNELLAALDFAERACYITAELFLAKPTLPYEEEVAQVEKQVEEALSFINGVSEACAEGDTLLEWLLGNENKEVAYDLPLAEIISVRQKLWGIHKELTEKMRFDESSYQEIVKKVIVTASILRNKLYKENAINENIIDRHKEKDEIIISNAINFRIDDLFDEDEEDREVHRQLLKDVLLSHAKHIRHFYNYYSGGSFMTHEQYMSFIRDCRIDMDDSDQLNLIFARANWKIMEERNITVDNCIDFQEDDDEFTLDLKEFVEVLIRLGHTVFSESSELSLADKIKNFLQDFCIPNTCKDRADSFRARLREPKVSAVIQEYRDDLRRCYVVYSKLDMSKDGLGKKQTLNVKEFTKLLEDAKLIGKAVDYKSIQRIFQNVQNLETTTEGEDFSEMSFGEFLEGISCVGIFKLPDPFQSLDERLDLFFREYFLKPLKAGNYIKTGVEKKKGKTKKQLADI